MIPLLVLLRKEQDLAKCAKCMTLSILEKSLPMQRSYDILASDISGLNW